MIQEFSPNHLPFVPKYGQVVYISTATHRRIDNYVENHYDSLARAFKLRGLDFCTFYEFADESLAYYAPRLDKNQREVKVAESFLPYSVISGYSPTLLFSPTDQAQSGIARPKVYAVEVKSTWYQPLALTFRRLAMEIYREMHSHPQPTSPLPIDLEPDLEPGTASPADEGYSGSVRFRVRDWEPALDTKGQELVAEIIERIDELRNRGVSTAQLRDLIDDDEPLSRIRITKDHRIYLPDYDNLEIQLPSLLKAVYFLFLRHPEGIRFKEMIDHHDELLRIYRSLQPIGGSARQEQSIRSLTDPLSNSIHEKCSRIREAFVSRFDYSLAKNYCITGKRGEPRRIMLDPTYVLWEHEG